MNSFIKIKALSLGAEIALIRREERRWIKQARWAADVLKSKVNHPVGDPPAHPHTIEAHARANYWGLRSHRLALRSEARVANIAHGFLRGRTYVQVEAKAYSQPNWSKVISLVQRHGEGFKDGTKAEYAINHWRKAS